MFSQEEDIQVGSGLGFPEFIRHTELFQAGAEQFLMNDTSYLRVTVKLVNHKS